MKNYATNLNVSIASVCPIPLIIPQNVYADINPRLSSRMYFKINLMVASKRFRFLVSSDYAL